MVAVRITLNEQAFRRMNSPNGIIGRSVQHAAGVARDNAKRIITQEGRIDTGALRQNVRSEEVTTSMSGVYWRIISDLPYSMYQHEGVQGPIYPRRAKVLRFRPKGGGGYIFRAKVNGFPGIYFLTRPLAELSVSDFRVP